MTLALFLAVIFLSVFVQSVVGFGSALFTMAILAPLMGVTLAAPVVALFTLSLEIVLLLIYHQSLSFKAVWQITAASLLGVPLGILALKELPEQLILFALGLIMVSYALYALSNLKLPELHSSGWAYGFGFLAGILGGAYNTSGPPVIVYGNCRGWAPDEFKANLQGFFFVSSLVVTAGHFLGGNVTAEVWRYTLWCLPMIALGVVAGVWLSKRISVQVFRKLVLGMLVILGASLMI